MSTDEQDLSAKLQRLESIEAHLEQHLRMFKLALTGLSIFGAVTLVLLLHLTGLM
jgi:hypothetical protein